MLGALIPFSECDGVLVARWQADYNADKFFGSSFDLVWR